MFIFRIQTFTKFRRKVTDRETDGQTDNISVAIRALRCKNKPN